MHGSDRGRRHRGSELPDRDRADLRRCDRLPPGDPQEITPQSIATAGTDPPWRFFMKNLCFPNNLRYNVLMTFLKRAGDDP